ncbi:uncharacterized protein KGF55_003179 [Candida pseudojiufengensis]|uniref:uncharacterized protein n=1 Tax=Candida pseudojiufengensis TaxID=497109 RepID=UPI002224E612|nr:uncharacterized protein KGF55_003179 [Candida pseudojiufengensis]KAI5962103.1 hypothetical protein KGF55_003179 [Candida pseudojiufengensis]
MILFSLIILLASVQCIKFEPFDKSKLNPSSIFEQFDYTSLSNSPWKVSRSKKYDEGRDEIIEYTGKWAIEAPFKHPGFEQDQGLVLKSKAAHYAISYKLPHTISNENKDLIIQYEVKLQNGLDCGGAYIKLLDNSNNYHFFNSETPYQIMFGPDKCGSENKVQFIIRKLLPTGIIEEKILQNPPMARYNDLSNLYTLILKPNQDFEVRINGEVAVAGNFIQDDTLFSPSINPPKEIIDENDSKPRDWDDREYIPDSNVRPPPDYEKLHQSPQIPDPTQKKPDDWDESAPRYIPDPKAIKPKDASDDWKPPLIVNPQCESGCGPWKAPLIVNENYKGPWFPPDIKNPNFQGKWKPRTIPNPNYYELSNPSQLDKSIGGIGFDLWNMDGEVLFDNIYLGNSIDEAELIGNSTFKTKLELEYQNKKQNKPKIKNEPKPPPRNFEDILNDEEMTTFSQFLIFLRLFAWKQYLDFKDFYFEFMLNPVNLILNQPLQVVVYGTLLLMLFTVGFGIGSVVLFLLASWSTTTNEVRKEFEDGDKIMILNNGVKSNKIEILEEVQNEKISKDDQTIRKRVN